MQSRLTYSAPKVNTELDVFQGGSYGTQSLTASTPDKTVPHFLGYKFTASYAHNLSPGSLPYSSVWYSTLGGSVYTLNGLHGPFKSDVSARFDYALTSYDYPHNTLSTDLTLTAARQIVRNVRFYGYASFAQFDNRYRYDAQNYLAYPPQIAPDGTPYPNYDHLRRAMARPARTTEMSRSRRIRCSA